MSVRFSNKYMFSPYWEVLYFLSCNWIDQEPGGKEWLCEARDITNKEICFHILCYVTCRKEKLLDYVQLHCFRSLNYNNF